MGNPVTGTNGGRAGFVPNAEAVDEVRIETDPYDASMGHAVGVFISATVKSGTNALARRGLLAIPAVPLERHSGLHALDLAGRPQNFTGAVLGPGHPAGLRHRRTGLDSQGLQRQEQALLLHRLQQAGEHCSSQQHAQQYRAHDSGCGTGDFLGFCWWAPPTRRSTSSTTRGNGHDGERPRDAHAVSHNTLPASIMTSPISKFFNQLYPLPNNPPQMAADGTNNFYDGGPAR